MRYIIIFFLLTKILFSQVNTEKYRNFGDSLGFSGIIKLDISIQTGNTNLQELGSEIQLEHKKDVATILLILKGEYGWNNGEQFSNEALAHLRFVHKLNSTISFELFSQVNYDKALFLIFRALGGTGLRFKLFDAKISKLWFGSAYMIEYERYEKPRRFVNKKDITSNRWSNYLSFDLVIQKNVTLSSVIYYQPRFDLWKDARILTENSLLVRLSNNFSLAVEVDSRYDHFPALGLKDIDTNSKLGFIYNF